MRTRGRLDFWDWIGVNRGPDWKRARWLGAIVGGALAFALAALIVVGIATLIQFLVLVLSFNTDHAAIRNIGLAVVAILGSPFIVWRAAVAQK